MVAQAAKEMGCQFLRGGAFKPRTSPYDFQGLEEKGLQYLADAREATGLLVVTEIMDTQDIELVAKYADKYLKKRLALPIEIGNPPHFDLQIQRDGCNSFTDSSNQSH